MRASMSKLSFLIILSIWGLSSRCVTPAKPSEKSEAVRQSFLWEAEKEGEILTLVGTMHVGITPEDMDTKLWNRISTADRVIIETDIGQSDPLLMQRYMRLPAGEDLSKMFGEVYWTKFYAILRDAGSTTPDSQLRVITPLAAGVLLLQSQAKEEEDFKVNQLSIDQIIYDRAKSLKKETRTFETNEQQLVYLKNVFTIPALKSMIDEWADESAAFDTMKSAFKNGDAAALDALLEEVPKEIRTSLLDERNEKWMVELPRLASKKHTLIAVGAAHFAGPKGLLKLLEKAGYTIRSLPSP